MGLPSERWGFSYFHNPYAVTNWHVACAGGASVIRVNLHSGGTEVIELDPESMGI